LVSFSQNRSVAAAPSGADPTSSSRSPRNGCSIITVALSPAASRGLGAPTSHDHVLRNHTVGSTWSVDRAGPAFVARTTMMRSVGSALT
jgi:hypothetical protein